jgi:hypothetical protein
MHTNRRAPVLTLGLLILILAACATPAGDDGTDASSAPASVVEMSHDTSGMASGSAEASASAPDDGAGGEVVTIDNYVDDPAAFEGTEITMIQNVASVLIADQAFLFTGVASEGELLVVVADGATVEAAIEQNRVVEVTGTVVPFTDEALAEAGATVTTADQAFADYTGEGVLVADSVSGPLGE